MDTPALNGSVRKSEYARGIHALCRGMRGYARIEMNIRRDGRDTPFGGPADEDNRVLDGGRTGAATGAAT